MITFVLGYILSWVYMRYGQSLSNRKRFGSTFPVLALTTMLIITVVKASLALSLGLVGALSIVRFRAAIKEPEELSFLFITIAIGLGLGAGQRAVTIIGFAMIVLAVLLRFYVFQRRDEKKNIFLTISSTANAFTLPELTAVLRENCASVDPKRYDQSGSSTEALFIVEFENFERLEAMRSRLSELDPGLRLTMLDQWVV